MTLTPAALDPVKPQVLHPRLAELWLIRCQTSLNSLIYGATFGNYVRVTDSDCREEIRGWLRGRDLNPRPLGYESKGLKP